MESNTKSEIIDKANLIHNLEALLFFYNEPVEYSKLAKLLHITAIEVKQLALELSQFYQGRGLRVVKSDNDMQLVALINDEGLLDKLDTIKSSPELTSAAKETLAIVLYLQPALEVEVDRARGVKSSRTLRSLLRRGYIDKVGDKYSVTSEAKVQLGISSVSDLKDYDVLTIQLQDLINGSE